MKKQKTAINLLLFTAILLMDFCGNANAQDNSTVKIGAQNWCIKNLNVSTYRNGDVIPQVQDKTKWANLTTGAWCYYENKTENGTKYGRLYNWYAVVDPRGLAPAGFHIPTDEEWTILTDSLGGEAVAGAKMKNTSGWQNNGNGTNESSFAGRPGGLRRNDGSFSMLGFRGTWWSSTFGAYDDAYFRYIDSHNGKVIRANLTYNGVKKEGYSVRCLKD